MSKELGKFQKNLVKFLVKPKSVKNDKMKERNRIENICMQDRERVGNAVNCENM